MISKLAWQGEREVDQRGERKYGEKQKERGMEREERKLREEE